MALMKSLTIFSELLMLENSKTQNSVFSTYLLKIANLIKSLNETRVVQQNFIFVKISSDLKSIFVI